jgi:hypothetical protein
VVAVGARLATHPRIRQVVSRNDTGKWNTDPAYPDGLYLGLSYRDRALLRLASVVIEQNDEWLVGRRYLSNHSLEAVLDQERKEDKTREETRELTPA